MTNRSRMFALMLLVCGIVIFGSLRIAKSPASSVTPKADYVAAIREADKVRAERQAGGGKLAEQTAQSTKQQRPITEDERTYLGAAIAYLTTANAQGKKVAQTMAGASDGSSTLTDIKAALTSAKRVERAGYDGDYRDRIKGNVPSCCADIATKIDETHRLFQAAMVEFLEYWNDQNTAHIDSGTLTLKRCITLMNATIGATNAEMKELKAK